MSATADKSSDSGRAYHTSCTGDALITVEAHQKVEDITLFGSCFCPFVQRVWVAFEILKIPYKVCMLVPYNMLDADLCLVLCVISYQSMVGCGLANYANLNITDEVDPYKKPKELLEVSPKGLVPGLRLDRYNPPRSLNESTVILDFLEEWVKASALICSQCRPSISISLAATTTRRSILPLVTNTCVPPVLCTSAQQ